jgi:hypothetical protein
MVSILPETRSDFVVKNFGPRVSVQLPRVVHFALYHLYKMSRGRPRKYKMKRESKAAKKAHTQLFCVPL